EPVAPGRLVPGLPRDLETICLKCLRKEPAKRYASADELPGDLRRFLERRPILARRVGPLGRLARWGLRNPAVAGLSAAVAVAVVAGFGGVTWNMRAAIAERDRADKAAAKAEAVTQFLIRD